ncbi:hypothetical protein V7S43_011680 [Phytophthora oleae]|uniref:RNase H type-1 domain-containing protein n=1 Tax=Phytophthora oleae TaxID=2107226 RepID=A0ABD3FAD4_9STRA
MDQVDMTRECREALHGAAASGHMEILQWFQDNGKYTEADAGTLVKAAVAGQLKVVQWIIDRDRKDDTLGYESGPDDGDRPRRTYITCLGGEARLAIHAAAINGHLEVAKYLHAKIDKPLNQAERELETRRLSQRIRELWSCFRRSAYPNIDDVIKELSEETMMLAAERGFLDVVKWLYTQYHADPTVSLFWIRGHVGEYGHSYNPIDGFCSVVDAAAGKGHLAIVQYLLQVGGKAEDKQFHKRRRTETHPDQINSHEVPASAGGFMLIARKAVLQLQWILLPEMVTWRL